MRTTGPEPLTSEKEMGEPAHAALPAQLFEAMRRSASPPAVDE